MDSDSHARSITPRRHTIAPTGLTASGAAASSSTASHETHQPPSSPTTSDSATSPSLTAADSNRSSLYSDASKAERKRLSLNFPIQPSTTGRTSRPQSWIAPTSHILPEPLLSPTSENLLTSVAAQERRVLELKEELHKAERSLTTLKKHYAQQEASRKRNDSRGIPQPLRPLNTALSPTTDGESDGQSVMQREMERRRSLLNAPRQSTRTVFSSGRHTRQLSLLSPDKTYMPSFPQPADVNTSEEAPAKPRPLTRSSTTSDIGRQTGHENDDRYDLTTLQREALMRTGKKMATDFKDGLFTFIEDLRQATIGDEAVNGTQSTPAQMTTSAPAAKAKSTSRRKPDDLIDIGGSFWKEHGLDEGKSASSVKKPNRTPQKQVRKAVDDEGESWDTWDTPNDRYDHSSSGSDTGTSEQDSSQSASSTPRTSTSSANASRDPDTIPWPALDKFSPTNLKKTASHLMREWEKSITPPAEARENTATGDYIGRAVKPATPTKKV